jgi:hypothetical protein
MKSALLLALAVTVAFMLGMDVQAKNSFAHGREAVLTPMENCATCDACEMTTSLDVTCNGKCQTPCAAGFPTVWMASSEDAPWHEAVAAYEPSRDDCAGGLCATKDPPPPRS